MKSLLSALLVAVSFATPAFAASDVVTIYSADGLHDGTRSWFETSSTPSPRRPGIKVQYVEGGSGGVVERVAKEKSNPQADVLVTLPPFIQKAAADGLLQPFKPAGADRDRRRRRVLLALVNNYTPSSTTAGPRTPPKTFDDLLGPSSRTRSSIRRPARPATARPSCCRSSTPSAARTRLRLSEEAAGQQPRPVLLDRQADGAGQQGRALCRQWRSADEHGADGRQPEHPGLLAGRAERRALGLFPALLHRPGAGRAPCRRRQEADRVPAEPGCPDRRSAVALGMPARKDVTPTDANFKKLQDAMQGVTIWTPDWAQVLADLPADVAAGTR